ncbi:MAG: winged helix-turn-helix domain-containing protein [Promethearchaeota archaeon]
MIFKAICILREGFVTVKLGVYAIQKLLHKLDFSLQRPRHKLKKADSEA